MVALAGGIREPLLTCSSSIGQRHSVTLAKGHFLIVHQHFQRTSLKLLGLFQLKSIMQPPSKAGGG